MLCHRLKTGDLAIRSERNAALIRTLSEAFRDRHKEYTNLRILAANEDTLLATKSECTFLIVFVLKCIDSNCMCVSCW